jgi:hypothetical protein
MSGELVLSMQLNGTPVRLGTIVAAGSSVNNHTTASAFDNANDALKGKVLLIQADAACHIAFGTTNAVAATTSDFELAAGQSVIVRMNERLGYGWIAVIGTVNLKVWELTSPI